MMGFFKHFVQLEGYAYVVGAMAFNKKQLQQEAASMQMPSYLLLHCDRFDEVGFPILESVTLNEQSKQDKSSNQSKCLEIVQSIDGFVNALFAKGGKEEDLLLHMSPYVSDFQYVLHHTKTEELELFMEQYKGFGRFASCLERLATAIEEGQIKVPK